MTAKDLDAHVTAAVTDASAADRAAIAAFLPAAFPDDADAADLVALLWAPPGEQRVRLVVREDGRAVGFATGTVQGEHAHLDLLAVAPDSRHRGIGSALLTEWESRAIASGATTLHAGDSLLTYAWPGVDMRWAAALSFLLSRGYRRTDAYFDMEVETSPDLAPSRSALAKLTAAFVEVRRAEPRDAARLDAFIREHFHDVWAREAAIALDRAAPTLFVAEQEGAIIGFGAHGVHRRALYGPIAVHGAIRGLGVGDVLSRLVLTDMAVEGVTTARIGWVAESAIPFYVRTVGARIARCYWPLSRTVPTS